jgi:hypothetical protein
MKFGFLDLLFVFIVGLILGSLLCGAAIKLSKICERPVIVEHMIGE